MAINEKWDQSPHTGPSLSKKSRLRVANIGKNDGGTIFGGPRDRKFENIKTWFNQTERIFILIHINRRHNYTLDHRDLDALNIDWLIVFLRSITEDLNKPGDMMNVLIVSKLKDYLYTLKTHKK